MIRIRIYAMRINEVKIEHIDIKINLMLLNICKTLTRVFIQI